MLGRTLVLASALALLAPLPRLSALPGGRPAAAPRPILAQPLGARALDRLSVDADRLHGTLFGLHALGDADPARLAPQKRAFQAELDRAVRGLPAPLLRVASPRERVRELREARPELALSARRAWGGVDLGPLRALAALDGELAALQLRAARELLSEASPLGPKPMRRNAALFALVGAYYSATEGATEAESLEGLAAAGAAFADGPSERTSQWRNLHAGLETAARHARNERPEQAAGLLRDLARLLRGTGDRGDRTAAEALEAQAPDPDSDAILAAKGLIVNPRLRVRTRRVYADDEAKSRARGHAVDSVRADFYQVLGQEIRLRRARSRLASPEPSAPETAAARKAVETALPWARRGTGDLKDKAARNLEAALAALEAGRLRQAAAYVHWASRTLKRRRADIVRIGRALRLRLAAAARPRRPFAAPGQ
ncbi:MAG: hypothetical protein HY554_15455 [Elusimicrobia bacterium]|nr:hypothetical protein [Elusimicrobiota bacterium]